MLWHGSTDLMDRRSDLLADLIVCLTRLRLPLDTLTLDLGLCLCRSEEIGCEFLTAHMIEDFFCWFQFFRRMDITRLHASVESHISIVRELTIVPHSRLLRGTREVLIVLSEVGSQLDSLFIIDEVLRYLLPVCLYSKI